MACIMTVLHQFFTFFSPNTIMVLKMRRNITYHRCVKVWTVTATYTAMAVTLNHFTKSKKFTVSVAATIALRSLHPAIVSSPQLPLWQPQQLFKTLNTMWRSVLNDGIAVYFCICSSNFYLISINYILMFCIFPPPVEVLQVNRWNHEEYLLSYRKVKPYFNNRVF